MIPWRYFRILVFGPITLLQWQRLSLCVICLVERWIKVVLRLTGKQCPRFEDDLEVQTPNIILTGCQNLGFGSLAPLAADGRKQFSCGGSSTPTDFGNIGRRCYIVSCFVAQFVDLFGVRLNFIFCSNFFVNYFLLRRAIIASFWRGSSFVVHKHFLFALTADVSLIPVHSSMSS